MSTNSAAARFKAVLTVHSSRLQNPATAATISISAPDRAAAAKCLADMAGPGAFSLVTASYLTGDIEDGDTITFNHGSTTIDVNAGTFHAALNAMQWLGTPGGRGAVSPVLDAAETTTA